MTYQQPPDDPKLRSDIDDLYEALFTSLKESTNRVDVVINVLIRMTCAIAVEHGADKETVIGATAACFDATLAAKALFDKFDTDTPLQ
jgi:hypothetical protein